MADDTINITIKAVDKASSVLGSIGGNLESFGKRGLQVAAGGIAAVGAGLLKMASDAEPAIGIADGFAGLASTMEGGADAMLAALQEASGGLITNTDLMSSFNQAAQLIGPQFAEQLPDAMQYLGKVAAATGEDMGYMLDSLVRGVGRLSPAILDNLAVQVNLTEAYQNWADANGVAVEEMSKADQQAAVMAETIRQLGVNTANLPDPSAPFATFKTTLSNIATEIGSNVLPALAPFLEMIGEAISNALPRVLELLEPFLTAFERFATALANGEDPLSAFVNSIMSLGFELGVPMETLTSISDGIYDFIAGAQAIIEPIAEWIASTVELQDVLIAFGIAGAIALAPIVASMAGPILAIGALIAVVALLREAWESDFLGIRTALTDAWVNVIQPTFEIVKNWLDDKLPIALEALRSFWEDTLLPGIKRVRDWLETTLIPFLRDTVAPWLETHITAALETLRSFWEETLLPGIKNVWQWLTDTLVPFLRDTLAPWLEEHITAAIETLRAYWEETLLPGIKNVWQWIQDNLIPLFEALDELLGVTLGVTIEALTGLWENVLQPALEDIWLFITNDLVPAVKDLWDKLENWLRPIIQPITDLFHGVSDSVGGITGAIQTVIGWIQDLIDRLGSIELPDWLTPGSPTPFELGLRGITDALRELARDGMPALSFGFGSAGSPYSETNPRIRPTGDTVSNYFTLNMTTAYGSNAASEFELMRASIGGV